MNPKSLSNFWGSLYTDRFFFFKKLFFTPYDIYGFRLPVPSFLLNTDFPFKYFFGKKPLRLVFARSVFMAQSFNLSVFCFEIENDVGDYTSANRQNKDDRQPKRITTQPRTLRQTIKHFFLLLSLLLLPFATQIPKFSAQYPKVRQTRLA